MITDVRAEPADSSVVWANRALCELLGHAAKDHERIVPAEHYPEATRQALRRMLPAALDGQRIDGRSDFLHRSGSRFTAEWTITPLADSGGEPRWLLMSLRAAGEPERIDALAAERERRAMARLSEVIAGGAHDFNNALTVIQNMTAIVLEDLGDEATLAEDLGAVIAAATDASDLARSLTAFGRRGARDTTASETFDFDLVVGQIVTVLRRALPKRIEVETELDCGLIVESNEGMLQQLIHQLLLTASEAITEVGSIRIISRTSTDDQGRPVVELTIDHDGSATATSAGKNRREPDRASGSDAVASLGLAGLEGLLEQHRIVLHVAGSPGAGTRVTVTLPA